MDKTLKQIQIDCCVYTTLDEALNKEDKDSIDKGLVSAEFGTRFGFESNDSEQDKKEHKGKDSVHD